MKGGERKMEEGKTVMKIYEGLYTSIKNGGRLYTNWMFLLLGMKRRQTKWVMLEKG